MRYDKENIIKKLNSLFLSELAASISFIFAYFMWRNSWNADLALIDYISFYILIFILLQGSYFWFYLRRKISGKRHFKKIFDSVYSLLKYLNLVLILCIYISNVFTSGYLVMNLFCLTFSLIEYINYFFVRLSYPINEFLSRVKRLEFSESRLHRELNG